MKLEKIRICDIKPYLKNAKIHTTEQLGKIRDSIMSFGYNDPIAVDENNEIIEGHGRLEALKQLNSDTNKEIEIIRLEGLTDSQKKAYRIAHNKLNLDTGFDTAILKEEFYSLEDTEHFHDTGFSTREIGEVWDTEESKEDDFNSDDAAQNPEYDVQEGEVWELGDHKLMCGSSTNSHHLKTLLEGEKARMIFTDPPYGVSYKGTNNPNGREWDVIKGDNLRGEELYDLIHGSFKAVHQHLVENPAVYVFYASKNHTIFEKGLNDAGYIVKQQLIWDKHHILGHSDYHWNHEPIMYCRKIDKNNEWFGDRCQKTILERTKSDIINLNKEELIKLLLQIKGNSTVWALKKDPCKEYVHPTQKPLSLAHRAILNSSLRGEVVIEPFAGSGSTLMACEQTHRKCRAMELDPKYVSAIIERWEKLTNKKAIKLTKLTNGQHNEE